MTLVLLPQTYLTIYNLLLYYLTIFLIKSLNQVFQQHEYRREAIYTIKSQNYFIEVIRKVDNKHFDCMTPNNINITGGFPNVVKIFVEAKVMERWNMDVPKGLVRGNMAIITEIIWPSFRRSQPYEE